MKKKPQSKLEELKTRIINDSKDARQTKKLLAEALRLQKAECEMNKLIDIPLSHVKRELDLGANKVYQSKEGYVFECKGGSYTFVEHRMAGVCSLFNTLFYLYDKKEESEESKEVYENFSAAFQYVMQSYIFSSLDSRSFFDIATAILKAFNNYAEENYSNAENYEETEQDLKENAEMENISEAIKEI